MVFKKKKPVQEEKPEEKNDLARREDETAQEYNERVNPALQPVQPGPTHSYLGEEL